MSIFVVESEICRPDQLFASLREAQAEVSRLEAEDRQQYLLDSNYPGVNPRIRLYDPKKDTFHKNHPDHQGVAPGQGQEKCKRIMRKVHAYWTAERRWWNDPRSLVWQSETVTRGTGKVPHPMQ